MKKRIITSFAGWFFIYLFLVGTVFFTDSIYAEAGSILWLLLPILSWLLQFYIRKYLELKIEVTPTTSKTEERQVSLLLRNQSVWAVGKVICQIEFYNTLTGEKKMQVLDIPEKSKGSSTVCIQMASNHCGYIKIQVKKSFLMDCFGFLPVQANLKAERKVAVLPALFPMQISLQPSKVSACEEENWSKEKGEDYTEVFTLRDYAAGDPLKQIHWKLSSKKKALIVREGSMPVTNSLLLFWDKNAVEAKPEEMDAMAEVAASICQTVVEMGISYTLGWTEEESCVWEEIQTEDDFIQALPRMLKKGFWTVQKGLDEENLRELESYGKILYFAKEIPEYIKEINDVDIRFLLCTQEKMSEEIYTFTPKNYLQDMALLEV